MKNGLWIAGLLLIVPMRNAHLLAEDTKWRAVDNPPSCASEGVSLGQPIAVSTGSANPQPLAASAPSDIVPVRYDRPVSKARRSASRPSLEQPISLAKPEVIAVSTPAKTETIPLDDEEDSDSLFAADRPFRAIAPRRRASTGRIRQTSALSGTPMDEEETAPAPVPLTPGWQTPVDLSWKSQPQKSFLGAPFAGNGMDDSGFINNGGLIEGGETAMGSGVRPPLGRRFYLMGEYLLWWLQGQQVPVLATTSAPSDFGILGNPTTQVLYGGQGINSGPFSGGRFRAGYWINCKTAIEVSGFFLGQRAGNFYTNSIDNPVIGRPFTEANNGQQTSQLTALPGVTAGALTVHSPTNLWGLAGNLRCLLCCGCNCNRSYRIYALAGFRNINLDENLTIQENIQGLSSAPAPFTNQAITVTDSFTTQNHFYGGNIGLGGFWYWGRFSVQARAEVALGDNVQILDISGSQRFVSPSGQVRNFTGGLLALPSNIGHYSQNAFSVVPEIGVNVGYNFTPGLRAFIGYNFLYWSNVIRPGTSIDTTLDVTQIPNFPLNPEPAPVAGKHPAPIFHEVGFWAQGITFGFQYFY